MKQYEYQGETFQVEESQDGSLSVSLGDLVGRIEVDAEGILPSAFLVFLGSTRSATSLESDATTALNKLCALLLEEQRPRQNSRQLHDLFEGLSGTPNQSREEK